MFSVFISTLFSPLLLFYFLMGIYFRTAVGGLQAPTISARDLGSHESRDRDLLAPEAKKPPTAVPSYVSVRSGPCRYH